MLNVVDEFSRFPFAFPYAMTDAKNVINYLNRFLPYLFCMPAFIHFNRFSAFVTQELTNYLFKGGSACNKTSVYNP